MFLLNEMDKTQIVLSVVIFNVESVRELRGKQRKEEKDGEGRCEETNGSNISHKHMHTHTITCKQNDGDDW